MNFDRYVGIPWAEQACGLAACNCWGLVRLIYRERRGIELPSYSDRIASAADAAEIDALIADLRPDWDEIPAGAETAFDLVLLRRGRFISHVGMAIEPGRLIHVSSDHPARVERYRAALFRRRVDGFFRHRQ